MLRWILWVTRKSPAKKSQNLPRKEQQKRLETTRSSTAVACFAPFEKRSVIIWDSIIIWEWAFEGILRPICREKGHSCGMAGWRIAANLAKFQLGPSHSFSLEQNLSFLLCFRCNLENHSFWSGLEEIYVKWDFNGIENCTTCLWHLTDNDLFSISKLTVAVVSCPTRLSYFKIPRTEKYGMRCATVAAIL